MSPAADKNLVRALDKLVDSVNQPQFIQHLLYPRNCFGDELNKGVPALWKLSSVGVGGEVTEGTPKQVNTIISKIRC